ncbi:MAG: hypothetical protein LBD82_00860 [Deltaproteobacteria bacterium]|jgi:hypothetical protein|nr:hypothetical protein [Deltaproteobacteria bacterium]
MLRICFGVILGLTAACPAWASDQDYAYGGHAANADVIAERGTVLQVRPPQKATHRGMDVDAASVRQYDHGLPLPDSKGGLVVLPGQPNYTGNASLMDARELKLKIRELAAQLVNGLEPKLSGHIALPLTFVSQDDFSRSSSFGRYMAEQLYYEFNQRGLRTREYRLNERIVMREDGEFILHRPAGGLSLNERALYVLGTYYTDGQIIMINARLIRSNGDILRTGQLIMNSTPFSRKLLAGSGAKLPREGVLEIRDFNAEARPPETVTAFDQGMDIH